MDDSNSICVCALYRFTPLPAFEDLQPALLQMMMALEIRGSLLLAHEGINGTVAGNRDSIDSLLAHLQTIPGLEKLSVKFSYHDSFPFHRARVKLKKEIVTMGVTDVDPRHVVGTYVSPRDWNDLISDPSVTVIDTRNDYEVAIGSFQGATNPHTKSFREFPDFAARTLDPEQNTKVAMFCTGGIRCEKSTALLKQMGFDEVFHLEGGILKYLEEVPENESLWQGECFVFDDRVTVDHQLQRGSFDQCHACRMPITETDMQSNAYVKGVSCPHCIDQRSSQQRARSAEREHQIQLAAERGEAHIGLGARDAQTQHREEKQARKNRQRGN